MNFEISQFIRDFLGKRFRGLEDFYLDPVQADGSKRLFWRVATPGDPASFIAMVNPPVNTAERRENRAYLMIGNHLRKKGVPVPKILSYDLDRGWFILEDLGKTRLHDLLSSSKDPIPIYEKILEHLFRLQVEGAGGFDTLWCCQTERYDLEVMRLYESNYFRDAFLSGYLGLKGEWIELEAPFIHLAEIASRAEGGFFLHRDFQSRNIMISKGDVGIMDWQGGRLGPLGYDLASLLIDPYADLSPGHRNVLYQKYLFLLNDYENRWTESFQRCYSYLAIQRNLQILGAFSYLTTEMKKPHFEVYIPIALKGLNDLLSEVDDPKLSPLKDLVRDLDPSKKSLDRDDPLG